MKILEKEIMKKEHLYENHVYCINFEKNKLALFDGENFKFINRGRERTVPYEKAQVFSYCSEYKGVLSEIGDINDLEIYEKSKLNLISKRAKYTAGFLNEENKKNLTSIFKEKIPQEWEIVCHHMTLNIGECSKDFEEYLNTEQSLQCTAFGIDLELGVAAIKVEGDLPSKNEIKHITFAKSENGKASNSNKIKEWEQVEKEIPIKVNVGLFLNNKDILIKNKKSNKPTI
jgi:hypothetical protein